MRQIMTFHPEWGCLAPAPTFMRTLRAVLVATAVGAMAGGGVVFALVDHSAGDQRSVAERTLVRAIPALPTSVSAAQTAQLSPQTSNQSEAGQVLRADVHVKDPAANESDTGSLSRPIFLAASDEVRVATGAESAKAAVAPSSTPQAGQKRIARGARHKNALSSSRHAQHSLPARIEPNAFQRFLTGLTAAVEHVLPVATSTANPISRAHANRSSAATT